MFQIFERTCSLGTLAKNELTFSVEVVWVKASKGACMDMKGKLQHEIYFLEAKQLEE